MPLVGHRGVRLSGGQVQRLALARALATDADLLLADDVSSALDAATEIELWKALRSGGATVIGATSKAAALAQADRVVVLDAGRVVDDGPWRELVVAVGAPGRLSGRFGRMVGWRHARRHRWCLGVPRDPPDPTTCGSHGHEVTALVRREPGSAHESQWDPLRRRARPGA